MVVKVVRHGLPAPFASVALVVTADTTRSWSSDLGAQRGYSTEASRVRSSQSTYAGQKRTRLRHMWCAMRAKKSARDCDGRMPDITLVVIRFFPIRPTHACTPPPRGIALRRRSDSVRCGPRDCNRPGAKCGATQSASRKQAVRDDAIATAANHGLAAGVVCTGSSMVRAPLSTNDASTFAWRYTSHVSSKRGLAESMGRFCVGPQNAKSSQEPKLPRKSARHMHLVGS